LAIALIGKLVPSKRIAALAVLVEFTKSPNFTPVAFLKAALAVRYGICRTLATCFRVISELLT